MASPPPTPTPTPTIYFPPHRPPIPHPSILLYGSMPPAPSPNWRHTLTTALSHLPISILNPTCTAWDASWEEDISFAPFAAQVEWEMWAAETADLIVFFFAPGTLAPVSLLELGLWVRSGKCVVCCPVGFQKRGNVQVVCGRFGVEVLGGLEELVRVVRERVEGLVG